MWPNPQLPADLVTFTEEVLYGKLHFYAMIILVNFQGLHENGKWISCVSNGVYTLSKKRFVAAPHCFLISFTPE